MLAYFYPLSGSLESQWYQAGYACGFVWGCAVTLLGCVIGVGVVASMYGLIRIFRTPSVQAERSEP